ncbi:uncharacterized protein LOC111635354 [Centruroides sculpturatus]|uniref:uncharacterized protein LOC111635354 n=1 Tax=Centruroides sculpturatus TaxID=218467 RepID=UPI000C6EB55B|nr:uncharacterized protein LOC111635354 [Centruroides sculpturatus]
MRRVVLPSALRLRICTGCCCFHGNSSQYGSVQLPLQTDQGVEWVVLFETCLLSKDIMQVVRVRVPLARPLVRFTLKRAIRMMPSVLLLMFVFSLIFVTLMQIAVIHANRRAHYIHRHELNLTSPLTSQPQSHQQTEVRKPQIPVVARVTKPLTKKPETLRVEALLDRNAPSVETNILLLQSRVNTARLKQVLRSVRTLGNNATTRGSAIVSTMSRKPLCPAVPTGLSNFEHLDMICRYENTSSFRK